MENINPILSSIIVLISENLAGAISLVSIVLACIVVSYIIALEDLFFYVFQLLRSTTNCLFRPRKRLSEAKNSTVGVSKVSTLSTDKFVDKSKLLKGDVQVIMQKLGMFIDPKGDQIQETIGSDELADLFDEAEPSVEEVKEAFGLFDVNNDGHIDPKELERVLSALGFADASELDCKKMIWALDDNGDGIIDLDEFIRLLDNSFF